MDSLYCCPHCFSDNFLQSHIQANFEKNGKCSFCKSIKAPLINADKLLDRFEPLLDLYEENDLGDELNNLIDSDWAIFNIKSKNLQRKLLKSISNNNNLFAVRYKPKYAKDQNNIKQWEEFREELKHHNRFFPKNAPSLTQIEPFGKYIGVIYKKGSQKFYRARINDSEKPFKISSMGKPPKNLVINGRANPHGIPYLYVASTIETAISEVRGHKGEVLTIAEFHLTSDIELADLRDPKSTISPFELNDEKELELIYKNMPFLTLLGNELSKPIIPREANLEYLSSQYLCELIKHIGFHGIIYKSSVSDGNNYVIFNDKKLKGVSTVQYQIKEVTTSSVKVS